MANIEDEIRGVSDSTAGSTLWSGPDTCHLHRANIRARSLSSDDNGQALTVPLTDVDDNATRVAKLRSDDYMPATVVTKTWAERRPQQPQLRCRPGRSARNSQQLVCRRR